MKASSLASNPSPEPDPGATPDRGSPILRLASQDPLLKERFLRGYLGAEQVARHPLASRWARARGAEGAVSGPVLEVSRAERHERKERLEARLGGGLRGLLKYEQELAARGVVGGVTDADSVVLMASRGGDFERAAAAVGLRPGVRWDERSRGVNGLGTTAIERVPIAVSGHAHLDERLCGVFEFGVPVLDPFGELAAVLGVAGEVARERADMHVGMLYTAAAMEHGLRQQAYSGVVPGGQVVLRGLIERTTAAALLIEAPGQIRMASRQALEQLGGRPHRHVRDVLGVSWEALTDVALAGGSLPAVCGGKRLVLRPEPLLDPQARVLAVLVYAEPEASPAPKSPAVTGAFEGILGSDPQIASMKSLASRLAQVRLPVLILADTGTGKELFARAIHQAGPWAHRPFVALNCAALSEGLLESELFGYAPGAFTGARREGREGKLAAAHGGTLFLDEVADMPESLQAALLRVLEDGSYYRVGDSEPQRADVRLVCATGQDLLAMVRAGRFRKDLFYRIHGACMNLPPLAQRSDREELARQLLERLSRQSGSAPPELDASALSWIRRHSWPGNVRELKMALQHALMMAGDEPVLSQEHFPQDVLASEPEPPSSRRSDPSIREQSGVTIVDAERMALEEALLFCGNNISEVARRLGVARSTVYRLLARHRPDLVAGRRV